MIKLVKNDYFIYCKEARIESNRSFYGSFSLGPFDAGQSITIANALRRTLLSELKGLAITSAEIEGAFHEYSTLPGVRESILDILLNLKDIVLKAINYGNKKRGTSYAATFKNEQIGYLKTRGPGIVTASELKLPPGIQCVDPDQYIATLSEEGILNIKFNINEGTNYVIQNKPPSFPSYPLAAHERPGEASPLMGGATLKKASKRGSAPYKPFFEASPLKKGGGQKGIIETTNKESGLRRLWLKKVKAIKSRLKCNSGFAKKGLCLFFLKKKIKARQGPLFLTPFTPTLPPPSTPPLLPPKGGASKRGSAPFKAEGEGGRGGAQNKKKALPYKGFFEKTFSEERDLLGKAMGPSVTKKKHDRFLKQKSNLPILKQRSLGVSKAAPLAIDAVFMPVNKVNYIIEINEQSVISKDKNLKTLYPPLSTPLPPPWGGTRSNPRGGGLTMQAKRGASKSGSDPFKVEGGGGRGGAKAPIHSLFYKAAQKWSLKAEPLLKSTFGAFQPFFDVRKQQNSWLNTSLTKVPFSLLGLRRKGPLLPNFSKLPTPWFCFANLIKRPPHPRPFFRREGSRAKTNLGLLFLPFKERKQRSKAKVNKKKVLLNAQNSLMPYGDNRQDLKSMPESSNSTQPLNVSKQQSTLESLKTGFWDKKNQKQGLAIYRPPHQPFKMFKTINSNIVGSGFLNINTKSLLSPLYLSFFPNQKGKIDKEKEMGDKEKLVFFPLASLAPLKQKNRIYSFAFINGAQKTFFVSFFPFHPLPPPYGGGYNKGFVKKGFLTKGWAATAFKKYTVFFKGALAKDNGKIKNKSLTFARGPLLFSGFARTGLCYFLKKKARLPRIPIPPLLLRTPTKKAKLVLPLPLHPRPNPPPWGGGKRLQELGGGQREKGGGGRGGAKGNKGREKSSDLESNLRPTLEKSEASLARGCQISVNPNVFASFNRRNHIENRIRHMRLSDYQTKTSLKNNIILEIWTNGSIHPRQALYDALRNLLSIFSKLEKAKFIRSIFRSETTYDNIALSPISKSNFSFLFLRKKKTKKQ